MAVAPKCHNNASRATHSMLLPEKIIGNGMENNTRSKCNQLQATASLTCIVTIIVREH